MKASLRTWTLAAFLAAVPAAGAAADGLPPGANVDYSIIGAETVKGKPVVDIQAGWPSTNFGYTFGLSPTSDLSLRFGLLYGFEGTTTSQFGLAFYAPLRFEMGRGETIRTLLHVDPGLRFYTTEPGIFGFQFPVGLVFGLVPRNGLEIGLGLDFNMTLIVSGNFAPRFVFGPALGPYIEYHVNPQVTVGLNTRFGAAIDAYSSEGPIPGGTATNFAFLTQIVLAYRP
jgi:hypothetical protein